MNRFTLNQRQQQAQRQLGVAAAWVQESSDR
jgi:hypothetical protein